MGTGRPAKTAASAASMACPCLRIVRRLAADAAKGSDARFTMALLLCRRFVHAGTLRMMPIGNSKRAGGWSSSAGDVIWQRHWGVRPWPSILRKSIAYKPESGWLRWLYVGCGATFSVSSAALRQCSMSLEAQASSPWKSCSTYWVLPRGRVSCLP